MKTKLLSAVLVLTFVAETFAATVWWRGTESTDLATLANWKDGADPTLAANAMGFGQSPSTDYTVTLADDLVSQGTWAFTSDGDPYRVTFDLGGHTLTYLTKYSANSHCQATTVIQNGTVAFTNAAGTVQEVRFWHANSGYKMFLEKGANFIGNIYFTDTGTKTLTVENGAHLRGSLDVRGTEASMTFRNEGTVVDGNGGQLSAGGSGYGSQICITDHAVVTNYSKILFPNSYNATYKIGRAYLCVSNATLKTNPYSMFALGYAPNNCGNRMDILGGAFVQIENTVDNSAQTCAVGDYYSHSNLLYVAGAGTVLTNSGALNVNTASDGPMIIGQNGFCNRLRVTDHATAFVYGLSAGGQRKSHGNSCVTSLWNRVTVDGGAKIVANLIKVATRHSDDYNKSIYRTSLIASNVVEVLEDGTIETTTLDCGLMYPSFDNAVVVKGENARLTVNGNVQVGNNGSRGNRLEVTDGGSLVVSGGDLRIGYTYATDTVKAGVPAMSNNWVRLDGCSFTNTANDVYLGNAGTGGNRLWIGSGSSISYRNVYVCGYDSEVIVSNGTLRTTGNFCPSWGASAIDPTVSGRTRISFYGANAKLIAASGSMRAYTNECTFAFHVPKGGYASAPIESASGDITIGDDTNFEFYLKDAPRGVKIPLVQYTGSKGINDRIKISDATLAKMQAAARLGASGARVSLTEDRTKINLRLTGGLIILFR